MGVPGSRRLSKGGYVLVYTTLGMDESMDTTTRVQSMWLGAQEILGLGCLLENRNESGGWRGEKSKTKQKLAAAIFTKCWAALRAPTYKSFFSLS